MVYIWQLKWQEVIKMALGFVDREFQWEILSVRFASGNSDEEFSGMYAERTMHLEIFVPIVIHNLCHCGGSW